MSSSYSGSTLLSLLLNAQPEIGTVSEFDARAEIPKSKDFMCSCGVEIRQCPFFKEIEGLLNAEGVDFSIERIHELLSVHQHPLVDRLLVGRIPYFQPAWLENLRDTGVAAIPSYRRMEARFFAKNEAFMRAVLELQGASVFLDANKDVQRMRLLSKHFDVKPIYIFKNGIAGVYSYFKNAGFRGHPWTVEKSARIWFEQQRVISRALKNFDGDFIQISYSALCRDVDGVLKRITDFLGVGFSPTPDLSTTVHHVIGNRMRLGALAEIKEDESWKSKFSESDVAVYRRVYDEYAPRLKDLNAELFECIWH